MQINGSYLGILTYMMLEADVSLHVANES